MLQAFNPVRDVGEAVEASTFVTGVAQSLIDALADLLLVGADVGFITAATP